VIDVFRASTEAFKFANRIQPRPVPAPTLPLPPLVAAITFPALHNSLRTLASISGKRVTHVVLGLGELAALAPYVALVALVWLNLRPRHGSAPEEQEQNDDRNWNPKQPKKRTSSHSCLRIFLQKTTT
jgi:hypothetical protein